MMKKITFTPFLIALFASLALLFAGCQDDGGFEDAGEGVDDAIEDTGDEIEDATD